MLPVNAPLSHAIWILWYTWQRLPREEWVLQFGIPRNSNRIGSCPTSKKREKPRDECKSESLESISSQPRKAPNCQQGQRAEIHTQKINPGLGMDEARITGSHCQQERIGDKGGLDKGCRLSGRYSAFVCDIVLRLSGSRLKHELLGSAARVSGSLG